MALRKRLRKCMPSSRKNAVARCIAAAARSRSK